MNKLDTNCFLLGCNNCVIDFKAKTHRKGSHDDYISKSTNINYLPSATTKNGAQKSSTK